MPDKVYLDAEGNPIAAAPKAAGAKVYLDASGEPVTAKADTAPKAEPRESATRQAMRLTGRVMSLASPVKPSDLKFAYEHPVAAGAALGGLAAAPFTGGASLAAAGLGSAGGAGIGEIVDQVRNGPKAAGDVLGSMGAAGALGAAGQGAAMAAGPALRLAKGAVTPALRAVANVNPAVLDAASFVPGLGKVTQALRLLARVVPEAAPASKTATETGGRLVREPVRQSAEDAIANALGELRGPTPAPSVELPPPPTLRPGYSPRTSAPAPKPPAETGGRLVREPRQTLQQELADALTDAAKPTPPARITTPPPAELPAGYTPRTTVPKPKAGTAAKPKPEPKAADATIGKGAYFLRKPPVASEPVEATGRSIGIEDLPASWRSRISQPLLETGQAGSKMADDVAAELSGRGLTAADALEAVQRNPALTNQTRLQLRDALLAMLGQQ